jgi:hypothetical protein
MSGNTHVQSQEASLEASENSKDTDDLEDFFNDDFWSDLSEMESTMQGRAGSKFDQGISDIEVADGNPRTSDARKGKEAGRYLKELLDLQEIKEPKSYSPSRQQKSPSKTTKSSTGSKHSPSAKRSNLSEGYRRKAETYFATPPAVTKCLERLELLRNYEIRAKQKRLEASEMNQEQETNSTNMNEDGVLGVVMEEGAEPWYPSEDWFQDTFKVYQSIPEFQGSVLIAIHLGTSSRC